MWMGGRCLEAGRVGGRDWAIRKEGLMGLSRKGCAGAGLVSLVGGIGGGKGEARTPKPVTRTWISSQSSGVSGPREPIVVAGGGRWGMWGRWSLFGIESIAPGLVEQASDSDTLRLDRLTPRSPSGVLGARGQRSIWYQDGTSN